MPSIYLHLLFIVLHDHFTFSVVLSNTMSIRYLLYNGIMAFFENFCILFLSVLVAWDKRTPHCLLNAYTVTYVWRSELLFIYIYRTYIFPIYIYSSLTRTGTYFVTFIDTIVLFILFISKTQCYSSSSSCPLV